MGPGAVDDFDNKVAALPEARAVARKSGLGQFIVHDRRGRIQFEWTYGADPRSKKG